MTAPMTDERLAEIAALDAEATGGPWSWRGNTDHPDSVRLAARGLDVLSTIPVDRDPNDVHPDLIDACNGDEHAAREWQRRWAWDDVADETRTDERLALVNPDTFMYEPAARLAVYEVARAQGLPDDTPADHPKVYRRDVVALRNPNARMLAEGRQAVTDLLAEVRRLRVQAETLCDDMAHQVKRHGEAIARAEKAEAEVARVRARHFDDYGVCPVCVDDMLVNEPYPCPTIRDLDGEAPE
jgi:hypothetical protein